MIFFAHNVIPHNHVCDSFESCKYPAQNSTKADREHSDGQICRLSNFLFHTLSPEVFLTCSDREINFIPDLSCGEIYIDSDQYNNSDHLIGISSLRAPPSA
jgi:hypothetical protein